MKTKHTSGKWRFDAKHGAICEGEAYSHFCKTLIARVNVDMGEESEANAKLIAAAPELLEALKYIVKWHRDNDSGAGELFGRDYITTAISAINKAETLKK